ncbi:HAD family hydrolase [Mycoplasmatota bacterium WC44]
MKKLYVTDLDGTLLNSKGRLSDYSFNKIQELIDKDVYVTFATARSLFTAGVVLDHFDFNIPALVYNGGGIIDTSKREFTFINPIDRIVCEEIFKFLTPDKSQPFVLGVKSGKEIMLHKNPESEEHTRHLENRLKFNDKRQTLVDEFYLLDDIINFTFIDTLEKINTVEEELKTKYSSKLTVKKYFKIKTKDGLEYYYLDVTSNKANKGNMIKELANQLDVKIENVIVFGDESNDIEMLQAAGTGIAVNNAVDKLKDVADLIIGSNDEDSVIKYICDREAS